jgi:hypothetical protein
MNMYVYVVCRFPGFAAVKSGDVVNQALLERPELPHVSALFNNNNNSNITMLINSDTHIMIILIPGRSPSGEKRMGREPGKPINIL